MFANPDIEYNFTASLALPRWNQEPTYGDSLLVRFIPQHALVTEWLYANLDPDTGGFDTGLDPIKANNRLYYRTVVFLRAQDFLAFKLRFGDFISTSNSLFGDV